MANPQETQTEYRVVTIRVLYSCNLCGLHRVGCDVPTRGEEDVLGWTEATIRRVSADHAARSPHCHPKTLSEMLVPMTGADKIGGPSVQ